jgi:O-antigen/teichoic acid export membrane protein
LIGNILNTISSRIGLAVISIILLVLNSNFLGSEGLGTVSLIVLEISIFLLLSNLITGGSLIYYASRIPILQLLLLSYLWILICTAIAYTACSSFSYLNGPYVLHILLLGAIQAAVGTHLNLLVGKELIKSYNSIQLGQSIVQVLSLCLFYFVWNKTTVEAFIYSTYIAYSYAVLLSLFKLLPFLKGSFIIPSFKHIKQILHYGFFIQTANISQLLNYRLSYFLLDYYCGRASVGKFTAGIQLSEGILLPGKSIGVVQYSKLSNSLNYEANARLSLRLMKVVVLLSLPLIVFLMVLPSQVFETVLGSDFSSTPLIIACMSLGILALSAEVILSRFFSGTGQQKVNAGSSTLGLVVSLIAGFSLIPFYGIVGAAFTASLSYMSMFLFLLWKIVQKSSLSYSDFLFRYSDWVYLRRLLRYILSNHKKPNTSR